MWSRFGCFSLPPRRISGFPEAPWSSLPDRNPDDTRRSDHHEAANPVPDRYAENTRPSLREPDVEPQSPDLPAFRDPPASLHRNGQRLRRLRPTGEARHYGHSQRQQFLPYPFRRRFHLQKNFRRRCLSRRSLVQV